jgi:hypothetical protein
MSYEYKDEKMTKIERKSISPNRFINMSGFAVHFAII